MSIANVSTSPTAYQANPQQANLRAAFSQLTTAIDAGDLQAAQKAYATLTDLQQSSGTSNGQSPFGKLLSSIGSALSAGDISGAQNSLQAFQKSHGRHHHHHDAQATGAGQDSSGDQTAPTTTTAPTAQATTAGSLDILA